MFCKPLFSPFSVYIIHWRTCYRLLLYLLSLVCLSETSITSGHVSVSDARKTNPRQTEWRPSECCQLERGSIVRSLTEPEKYYDTLMLETVSILEHATWEMRLYKESPLFLSSFWLGFGRGIIPILMIPVRISKAQTRRVTDDGVFWKVLHAILTWIQKKLFSRRSSVG